MNFHKARCEWCGKERILCTHHLIPRWCGGLDGDIIEACRSCHRKLEERFSNFIKYGAFQSEMWQNPKKRRVADREYQRNIRRRTTVFFFTVDPTIYYRDMLAYNLNTDYISFRMEVAHNVNREEWDYSRTIGLNSILEIEKSVPRPKEGKQR